MTGVPGGAHDRYSFPHSFRAGDFASFRNLKFINADGSDLQLLLRSRKSALLVEPYTFVMSPRTQVALAKLKETTTDAPLAIPPALADVAFKSSTRIPNNLGGGTNESLVIAGDYRECWLGIRMEATVELLRELYAANYQYGFLVSMRADVQLAHEGAFCKLTGITP
jgi:predicted phage gp36 major capsid-like protein